MRRGRVAPVNSRVRLGCASSLREPHAGRTYRGFPDVLLHCMPNFDHTTIPATVVDIGRPLLAGCNIYAKLTEGPPEGKAGDSYAQLLSSQIEDHAMRRCTLNFSTCASLTQLQRVVQTT